MVAADHFGPTSYFWDFYMQYVAIELALPSSSGVQLPSLPLSAPLRNRSAYRQHPLVAISTPSLLLALANHPHDLLPLSGGVYDIGSYTRIGLHQYSWHSSLC